MKKMRYTADGTARLGVPLCRLLYTVCSQAFILAPGF
jgi:hypothetical protein